MQPTALEQDHRGFLAAFYNRTAGLLRKIDTHLTREMRASPIYPRDAVRSRLVQEIAYVLSFPMRRMDADRARENRAPVESQPHFSCAGLLVDTCSGEVRCSIILWARCVGRFVTHWVAVLGLGATSLGRARERLTATLLLGVPEENLFPSDDRGFADFTRSGPLTPLKDARYLFVQTQAREPRTTDPARIGYARHPLLALLRANPASIREVAAFAAEHLRVLVLFLSAVLRRPLIALLWRDYVYEALVDSLNRRGLIDAFALTSSYWGQQFLWVTDLPGRKFASHMIFYSMNDRPHCFVDVAERCPSHPTLGLIRADHFWVWTEGQAHMLTSQGVVAEMHVVGPILWTMPGTANIDATAPHICVFDITPITSDTERQMGLLGNYFNTENLLAFLDGIEQAAQICGTDAALVLKPKRNPKALHDTRYLRRVAGGETFRLVPPSTSPYEVVAHSALAIVYPFSSAAYVADAQGVRAVYFDPTGRLAPTHEPRPHIRFTASVAELAAEMRDALDAAADAQTLLTGTRQ